MGLNARLWRTAARLSFFLVGFAVPVVLSAGLQLVIRLDSGPFAALVALLGLMAVTFLLLNNLQIDELIARLDTTVVSYVEEKYAGEEGGEYLGKIYYQMETLVRNAQSEILVLTDASTEVKDSLHPANLRARRSLLQAYAEVVEGHAGTDFTYTRIIQVPLSEQNRPLAEFLSPLTIEHCQEMLNFKRKAEQGSIAGDVDIAILKKPIERLTTMLVIDRRYIVVTTEDLYHTEPYLFSALTIEDHQGKLGAGYHTYFEDLRAEATPLKTVDLTHGSPIGAVASHEDHPHPSNSNGGQP